MIKYFIIIIISVAPAISVAGDLSSLTCSVTRCGKYTIEKIFKAKIRCVDSKSINNPIAAKLVEDNKCSLILSEHEGKKKVYYSVLTTLDRCSSKTGSVIEIGIRKGAIQKGREGQSVCPSGAISMKLKQDNPENEINGKELEQYVDANVFGVSAPHYPY